MPHKTLFVTVGTTRFDSLTQTVTSTLFLQTALQRGYTTICIQHGHADFKLKESIEKDDVFRILQETASGGAGDGNGNGDSKFTKYETLLVCSGSKMKLKQSLNNNNTSNTSNTSNNTNYDLRVIAYKFQPSLQPDMESADLIMSHAGAGSILESMLLRKPVIVIVNDELMDNHQAELAVELHRLGHVVCGAPRDVVGLLRDLSVDEMIPWVGGDSDVFGRVIDELMFSGIGNNTNRS